MNPLKKIISAVVNYGTATPPDKRRNATSPLSEPSNLSAWATMQDVQNAVRAAENGDPTNLFRFYRDSLMGDEHIQGELNKRKLAVIGQPMSVLPADKENPEDVLTAVTITRAIADCENWIPGLSALLSSSQWPVSVSENIFRAADPRPLIYELGETKKEARLQYTLKRIESVNPMLFCFKHAYGYAPVDPNEWEPYLRLYAVDDNGRILQDATSATPLDPLRHIVHRGHLMTEFRDNWGGPMRAILAWWLLRGLGRDYFGRFMERYGSPFPVGKTDTEDSQAVALLQEAFRICVKIGGLIIGQDDHVELVQAQVQGGAEGHERWHNVCNDAISFHITGIKSSQRPQGLNAGESHRSENIREDVRVCDQKLLSETLCRQLFDRIKKFNGRTGEVRLIWGGLSDDDAATFATLVKTMSDAGWEPTDEAIPSVEEKTGLQWQRKALPQINTVETQMGNRPKTLSHSKYETRNLKLLASLRAPHEPDAVEQLVTARKEKLAAAYKGVMAPFRQAIEDSTSREDLERRLKTLYADWSPERLQTEIETALQIAAAAGAAQAKTK